MQSIILSSATRLLVGLILVFSVYLLWRGHHLPGGGFAAALVAATGFALFALAEGQEAVRRGLRADPRRITAAGLIVALTAGLLPLFSHRPFLTGLWGTLGPSLSLGTPLLFDVGVFLVVLGTVLTLLLALEES
ncbi:MAG: Na+/H+ antiporter subunit B [Desulfobacterales bacterium]|jgi:multisubunit Na+/H+ antiporter MnhB subunit|nr:Na+/H+ antiporter subunit B [Desulfobacteraceae bacterium]MDD3992396.1 Na+/H+ antiporter subunit B [Desulfobacteraceae bacterium]MDY0312701.1 Na+/H+ antiporter subunit B [Desulfobacterales bacterium]